MTEKITATNEALKVSAHEQAWNMALVGPDRKTPQGLVAMVFGYSPEGVSKRAHRLADCHTAMDGIPDPAAFVQAARGMAGQLKRLEYWFDTDPEILAAMTTDERADNAKRLANIREALSAFRAATGEA